MSFKCCRLPIIVKNKFISTAIGTFGIYLGIGFILPISYLAVYITSYINLKQKFVNMYYGYFLNLILTLSMTFSVSFGGLLESKIGFHLIRNINYFYFKYFFLSNSKYLDLLLFNFNYRNWSRNFSFFIRKKFNFIFS